MKKIVSIIVVLAALAAALWVGATWFFGVRAEKQYRSLLEKASGYGYGSFTAESYERGLLEATARTRVALPLPVATAEGGAQPSLDFILVHTIQHGPLLFGMDGLTPAQAVIETRLLVGAETLGRVRAFMADFPEELPLTSTMIVFLGGGGELRLAVPPFQRPAGEAGQVALDWRGFDARTTFGPGFRSYKGSWQAPGLEISGDNGRFRLAGLKTDFDLAEGVAGLTLGDIAYGIDALEFAGRGEGDGEGKDRFALRGLRLKGTSRAAGELVNLSMLMEFDQAVFSGNENGPGVFEMEIRNLDAPSLGKLQQQMQQLQAKMAAEAPEQLGGQVFSVFAEIWPALAAKSPELEIRRLGLRTADGELQCSFRVAVDGPKAANLSSPLQMLSALSAETSVTVTTSLLHKLLANSVRREYPAALAASGRAPLSEAQLEAVCAIQGQQRLESLVAQNFLVREGEIFRLTASYRPGEALLNGRPIPLGAMAGAMGGNGR